MRPPNPAMKRAGFARRLSPDTLDGGPTFQANTYMGRIIVSENVTLDGVAQDPAGAEGFARGGWVGRVGDRGREGAAKALLEEALGAEAQLFGRRTYKFLAARWPSRSGALADRLNTMPKYVISSTLKNPKWSNSTVLNGDAAVEVGRLKRELSGSIIVAGSITLVRTLIERDLVDELRLMIYPVVLGDGDRLFATMTDKVPMRLNDSRTLDDGLVYLTYERLRTA
jgi:dihydrofolate reductase